MSKGFFETAQEFEKKRIPFVIVTVLSTRGHAPQDPGAKAIVTSEGLQWGTVGGGKVEAQSIQFAQSLLSNTSYRVGPELKTWNLQRDVGMTCGGEMTYFFEPYRFDSWKVVVFGAGHVGQALIRALEPLECHITCIDPRLEWLERLPKTERIHAIHASDSVQAVENLNPNSFFVVMTQGHLTDVPILKKLLSRFPGAPYIGVIGSKVKALKVRAELKECGIPEEIVQHLHCPMGLPFGGQQPAEIAISIVAELLQVRDSLSKT